MIDYHSDPKINALLNLLDDENENVAVDAIAELLFRENELGDAPAHVQEHGNALARKRIHQLQAALTLRRRRRQFSELLAAREIDLIDGLIEVHLQWFDNDSKPALEEIWRRFAEDAARFQPATFEQLSYFMRKRGMVAVAESTMQPENYCIGTIIENNTGAASVLTGLAWALANAAGAKFRIVRMMGEFALLNDDGMLLLPRRDWEVMMGARIQDYDFWEPRTLLKFASTMLFSHAVNSDSFRYVQTIAQALAGLPDGELPRTFPYPYYPAPDEEEHRE